MVKLSNLNNSMIDISWREAMARLRAIGVQPPDVSGVVYTFPGSFYDKDGSYVRRGSINIDPSLMHTNHARIIGHELGHVIWNNLDDDIRSEWFSQINMVYGGVFSKQHADELFARTIEHVMMDDSHESNYEACRYITLQLVGK